MWNAEKLFAAFEDLSQILHDKSEAANTKAGTKAYADSAIMILNQIQDIKEQLVADEEDKLTKQMQKFDIYHNVYDVIKERGHIGECTALHANLSDFSLGVKSANDVFENLPDIHKHDILSNLACSKEIIEQLAAYRYGFHFITHTKGHDGISPNNKVFEVKNRRYSESKKNNARMSPHINFGMISLTNHRKLDEGRPEIILNVTDKHLVLIEMRIRMSDKILDMYKAQVEKLKESKVHTVLIGFSDYKDDIIDVPYIHEDIEKYNIQRQVLDYVNEIKDK